MSIVSGTSSYDSDQPVGGGSFIKNLAAFFIIPIVILGLVVAITSLGLVYFEGKYRGRIYPGVVVWGTDLEGMTPDEATAALTAAFPYPNQPAFTFRDPGTGQMWTATPADLGLTFDVDATVADAYALGRGGFLWEDLQAQLDLYLQGHQLSPVLVFDSNKAISWLEAIAMDVYQPVTDAGIVFAEDQLLATPSQIGRQVDMADAYEQLAAPLGTLTGAEITLTIDETSPVITDEAVAEVLAAAEQIVSEPITVYLAEAAYPGDEQIGPLTLTREQLVNLLILELDESVTPPRYQVRLDEAAIAAQLEPLVPLIETEAANAQFIFNDDTRQLEVLAPSVPARALDIEATVAQIVAQSTTDDRQVPLAIKWIKPAVSEDATAEELGITELVAQGQTFFPGSSSVRVHNVAVAASRFHGIVIGPGETFSFNQYLGDVSEETGFEKGLIIFGGRTIEGVGGGVCQVSTTAFQAAFYAGFPIMERHPHGYRVSYYEHGEGPGLDATVFYPDIDLQFINDTPYHLLIETYTNERAQRLTFKFYSTNDGRVVEKVGPEITDVVPHPPDLYEEDPELPTGEIKQVDWAADGANVLVERIIRGSDGSVLREDGFFTHYLPWQAVYHYGPGTEGMPPEPEETPEPGATPEPTPTP
jgi:vancomycin resistance protein YoaR